MEPTGKSTTEAINEILMDTGLQEKHLEEQRLHIYPMPLHVVLPTVLIEA